MTAASDTAIDRRAARSRDLLLTALVSLMAERGFERLTTQNLIDRAGVGRATFYAHFQNKDELLVASVGRLRAWLEAMGKRDPDVHFGFMLPFFDHIASHRAIYRTTFERESEVSVERHIRAMLRELVRADLVAHRRPEPLGGGERSEPGRHGRRALGRSGESRPEPPGGGERSEPGRHDSPAIELATQFVVSTLWAVIVWWMDGGAKQPAAEVHAVFRRLAAPGLALTLDG